MACPYYYKFERTVSQHKPETKKITTLRLQAMKQSGEPITMLTAYDYTMARLLDRSGVEILLVGDSAANVMAGHSTTLPITLDQMIYHGASVVRGVQQAFVIVDMPFGSYQISQEAAVSSAVRIMKETGCDALKLEGGEVVYPIIQQLTTSGIPVMGHLGLTPQSVHQLGGYRLQGQTDADAGRLLREAKGLEQAGCFALVLEKVPATLARRVASDLRIPVIGIGAGSGVDGQVLVTQDMLGMEDSFSPKFLRRFGQIGEAIDTAVTEYIQAVKAHTFPSESESYQSHSEPSETSQGLMGGGLI